MLTIAVTAQEEEKADPLIDQHRKVGLLVNEIQ